MNRESKRNINDSSGGGYNLNKQMKIPELKKWSGDMNPDWPKDDKRMIPIGQNGNTGEHYDKI